MILNRRLALGLSMLCLAGLVVGCAPEGRKTLPVKGTLTLDGAPVAEAAVMFTGPDGGAPVATTTDESGNFTLDAIPGLNKIAVSKSVTTGEAATQEEGGTMPEESALADVKTEWLIPVKYASDRTSGLQAEVTAGMDPVKLDLTSK